MNKAKLKSYAPQARQDFIAAVTARANLLGLSDKAGALDVAPAQPQGDVVLIAGQAWPVKVQAQRAQLVQRMTREGFGPTCEAVAYTWFNRFAALRYMELHDYLGHGHRALSSAEGHLPDILTHAADLAQSASAGIDSSLPGLNASDVLEMKLAGNRDGELYRLLLVAQCNALNAAMPFLFERIDDDTELLLPDNLLRTDSVIAKLVQEIPEEDWAEVEIIGWLYQFYISEKKDQVIGKVVKSEDIPAATQLFTPNWIVQYLVQNSVGRLWLMANPASTLASQWPYYIQPASQTPEVQAQLDALIQTRMDEDGGSLNPETITVLDPASGSGHILVVAYDVLKAIYLERGYQARAIPRLILEKNLYGLDIDDRAAQMAGFALLMKARADDRRLFVDPPKLNVLSLQESKGLDAAALAQALASALPPELSESTTALAQWGSDPNSGQGARGSQQSITDLGSDPHCAGQTHTATAFLESPIVALIKTFTHAKTLGSLIQIGPQPLSDLRNLLSIVNQAIDTGDLYAQAAAQDVLPLVQQALVLGMQFDAVVANPPYMGGKGMNPALKEFAKATFPDSKSDLFAMFMERGFGWCKPSGFNSMVTMQSWMFLSSFETLREKLLLERTIQTVAHLGARAFSEISGEVVQTTAFVISGQKPSDYKPTFIRLIDGQEVQKQALLLSENGRFQGIAQSDFNKIPGSPLVYWLPKKLTNLFKLFSSLNESADLFKGLSTGENEKYIRQWYEVSLKNIFFNCLTMNDSAVDIRRWYPCNKGGGFRKWFGNRDAVIDWKFNGKKLRGMVPKSVIRSPDNYFLPCLSWSKISSGGFSMRYFGPGFVPLDSSSSLVSDGRILEILALVNSKPFAKILSETSPTLNYEIAQIGRMPDANVSGVSNRIEQLVAIHKQDWEANENDWGFTSNYIVLQNSDNFSVRNAWRAWENLTISALKTATKLEEENNRLFIEAYGLQDELSPEVPESQITLTRADREKDCQRLISYAIGCMMGRYSLDEPGLIYAHAGNVGFDASRYATFPADADGIVPLTDELWFTDDAASRISEFLRVVWGADTLADNMAWLAESLGKKSTSVASQNVAYSPEETIRRYLADKFFKDHLQTYKKRPIYWLFSSGKQGAFQALVYLHRYTEGTLARLRAEYVVPLTGKLQMRIAMLQKDLDTASSTAGRNKLTKEIDKLKKKHVELLAFDEQLRHYADMRITLDLDDGVKVNYGKFGDLLDSVKVVTGGAADE